MAYNWLYTSWSDNEYILFLIVVILSFIIIDFGLIKRKSEKFFNITVPTTTVPTTTVPTTTQFDKYTDYKILAKQLYKDAENEKNAAKEQNDILQSDSTLFQNDNKTENSKTEVVDYSVPANWATVDELGKSLTDTLGGIKSQLGYTLLTEQLGTFNTKHQYDNTKNYNTGINADRLIGAGTKGQGASYQPVGKQIHL